MEAAAARGPRISLGVLPGRTLEGKCRLLLAICSRSAHTSVGCFASAQGGASLRFWLSRRRAVRICTRHTLRVVHISATSKQVVLQC
jgi:hypothetical protein